MLGNTMCLCNGKNTWPTFKYAAWAIWYLAFTSIFGRWQFRQRNQNQQDLQSIEIETILHCQQIVWLRTLKSRPCQSPFLNGRKEPPNQKNRIAAWNAWTLAFLGRTLVEWILPMPAPRKNWNQPHIKRRLRYNVTVHISNQASFGMSKRLQRCHGHGHIVISRLHLQICSCWFSNSWRLWAIHGISWLRKFARCHFVLWNDTFILIPQNHWSAEKVTNIFLGVSWKFQHFEVNSCKNCQKLYLYIKTSVESTPT